jgi:sulfide dehydrogenase cytochrome subunit
MHWVDVRMFFAAVRFENLTVRELSISGYFRGEVVLIKTHRLSIILGLAAIVSIAALTPARADVDAIAAGCGDCHGANGVSSESDVPTIAGVSAFVTEDYLYNYRDKARPCHETKYRGGDLDRPATDMCEIAAALSEDDMTAIAEHYASLPFTAAKQDFDAALAAVGESIHKRDCAKCHTDNGSNPDDDAGILAGQWMPYLQQVFADYMAGDREYAEDKMQEKLAELSAADIEALINFYGSQQ